MKRNFEILLGLACLSLLMGAAPTPDVVLITIDTLRADRLGCYGYELGATPNLDALAAEGVRYEFCQSPTPMTFPSHASILTGREPARHGVRNNSSYRFPTDIPTLAEILEDGGYRNGAFVAAVVLSARYGLHRGFEFYDDSIPPRTETFFGMAEKRAGFVARSAITWARSLDGDAPMFLWVHFFEPHSPYQPVSPFAERFADRPYDGEVAAADAAVRFLFTGLDEIRGTRPRLTVVTSDHGESLGEHGESTHTMFLFDATQRVPLIMHAPDLLPSGVVSEPVALIDLAPTILDLVGLDAAKLDADGVVLRPGTRPPRRQLYAETLYPLEAYGWSPSFSLRDGPRKVIRSRVPRAYRIDRDPNEMDNLLGADSPDWATTLLVELDQRVAMGQPRGERQTPSSEELEALRSLGYVGAIPSEESVDLLEELRSRPDAADHVHSFETFTRSEDLIREGKPEAALAALSTLDLEGNAWGWILKSRALENLGRIDETIETLESVTQLWPNRGEIVRRLARLYRRREDMSMAAEHYAQALALDPYNRYVLFEVAEFHELQGDTNQRDLIYGRSLEDSALPPVLRQLVKQAQAQRGDRTLTLRARQLWREYRWPEMEALLAEAASPEELLYLAVSRELQGQLELAVETYERSLALDGRLHMAHGNLAGIFCRQKSRLSDAAMHAKLALELFPTEIEYHEYYLQALELQERNAEAKSHLQEILGDFLGDVSMQLRAHRYGL